MADTDWGGFTDVTSLLGTDVLLAARSGAGINFPVSLLLFKDASGRFIAGNTEIAGGGNANTLLLNAGPAFSTDGGASIALRGKSAGYNNGGIEFYTGTGATGVERLRIDGGGIVRPGSDNAQTLGASSFRWSTIYAATGTINTSDAREKAWRGGLSDAEIRAGRRIIRELGWYQWLAEIERKGEDGARLHFGVRAQQVIRILIEEGIESAQDIDLPADQFIPKGERPSFRSAFLCFDTWEDEWQDEYETVTRTERRAVATPSTSVLGPDGQPAQAIEHEEVEIEERAPTGAQILMRPAGNRFGLRLDQLTLFLIAVQDAVHAAIEARLAALEA